MLFSKSIAFYYIATNRSCKFVTHSYPAALENSWLKGERGQGIYGIAQRAYQKRFRDEELHMETGHARF
jgi:hypothetical protein